MLVAALWDMCSLRHLVPGGAWQEQGATGMGLELPVDALKWE